MDPVLTLPTPRENIDKFGKVLAEFEVDGFECLNTVFLDWLLLDPFPYLYGQIYFHLKFMYIILVW